MIGTVNSLPYHLASLYNENSSLLADSLTRISSGKKISSPSDDYAGYIRAQNYQQDISGYELVKENLIAAKVYTDTAVSTATEIYDDLTEMKELKEMYTSEVAGANDADVIAGYTADFNALRETIEDAIQDTYVDGKQIISTTNITTVNLDPSSSPRTLAVTFTAVPDWTDIDDFDITTTSTNDIDAELTDTRTYLSDATHFSSTINRQLSLTDTIITSKQAAASAITDIDEAEEKATMLSLQIRTQASLAMVTQANLNKSYISVLYGFSR